MAFIETPRFPLSEAFEAVGGPEWNTAVVILNSGFEQRNQGWIYPRSRYQLAIPLLGTAKDTFMGWFNGVGGKLSGFRYQDQSDFQATDTTGRLGTSTLATGVQIYQLHKAYAAGATEQYRRIRKPEYLQPITLKRNAVTQTVGGGAGNYSLDTTTGLVTFVADGQSSATSITPGATTQVVLSTNPGSLTGGQLLYLSGFAGADAAFVNNLAHSINSVAGGGPFTFTLATNTAGKTITLGSGIGRKFAQASETLSWSGNFDVPVRFDTDYAALTYQGPNIFRGESFQLIEIRT